MMNSKTGTSSTPIRLIKPYASSFHVRCVGTFAGKTVREILNAKLPGRTLEHWTDQAERGHLRVDGILVSTEERVREGGRIEIHAQRIVEPAVPDTVRIVDESAEYLVARKPAPMPVHEGGRYRYNSLKSILESETGASLRVIHRLDVVTSGLVLFGKTADFTAFAQHQLASGNADKTYLCRVSGCPEWDTLRCTLPVYRKAGIQFAAGEANGAKSAQTDFSVIEAGNDISLIQAKPLTGRTHQIRVHLQALGHPVINDPLYGPDAHEHDSIGRKNRPIHLFHTSMVLSDEYFWQANPPETML